MSSYTTVTKVQDELRLSTAFSSATLPSLSAVTTWIEEESSAIDQIAGRTFAETSYSEYIDYDGSERIQLKHAPIISVTSLLYSSSGALGTNNYSLTDTQVEDYDFTVYNDRGEIMPLFNRWSPQEGEKRMLITYTAGYATTPANISRLATKMVAKRVIDSAVENDITERNSGKSISVGSISITKSVNMGTAQYTVLKQEIQELKDEIARGSGVYRYTNY